MTGSDVDRARAALHRDKVGAKDDRMTIEKGMARLHSLKLLAFASILSLARDKSRRGFEGLHQLARDDDALFLVLEDFVFNVGIDRDRHIRRQGPRRRCPNGNADGLVRRQPSAFGFSRLNWEANVNRCVIALLVFYLGFSQRRLGPGAPENRLERLIDEAFLHENG